MLIKIEITYIAIVFSCYLTGVYMQNPSCAQIDFNSPETVLKFKQCEGSPSFAIRSYENVSIEPFRSTSEYHLANTAARSCFETKQLYNLNEYSEINAAIYLNSNDETEMVYVDINVIDTGSEGLGWTIYWVATVDFLSNQWNEVNVKISEVPEFATIKEAMIEIRSSTGDDTILAIEYINILNPRKADQYCRRVTAPPATTDPVTNPPITSIPTANYPVTYPPVTDPPVTCKRRVTAPPATTDPVTNSPITGIPTTNYPVTDTPVTDAPVIPTVPVEDCKIRCSLNKETDELKNQALQQGKLIKELYEFVSNHSQRIFELEKIIMGE